MASTLNLKTFAAEMMGRQVYYSRVAERVWNLEKRLEEHVFVDRHRYRTGYGWITGVRWLRSGYTERDSEYGNTFHPVGSPMMVFLVVEHPNGKPVRVDPTSVELCEFDYRDHTMSERSRKWLSEDSKNWPRDERGRFLKESC